MNNLMIKDSELRISSREVAEMMEVREHSKMLRKIDDISKVLNEAKVGLVKYWVESSYQDAKGEIRREYQVSKKGCEFLAHKSIGEKGILFTAKYMDRFEAMKEELQNKKVDSYMIDDPVKRAKKWIEEEEYRRVLSKNVLVQSEIIKELTPKAELVDKVLKSRALVTTTVLAQDYGMTAQQLNKLLHTLGVQYKSGKQWVLYSKYKDMQLMHSETLAITHSNGEVVSNTKWTMKGKAFIYRLLKDNGIFNVIEQIEKEKEDQLEFWER